MKTEPTEACKMIEESWYAIPYMGADYPQDPDIVIDKEDVYEIAKKAFQEGQSNPKIKQLEWDFYGAYYSAETPVGHYVILQGDELHLKSFLTYLLTYNGILIADFNRFEEAKAAAQADLENRIKECLE